jgi:arylsulfatase A-like enzyme
MTVDASLSRRNVLVAGVGALAASGIPASSPAAAAVSAAAAAGAVETGARPNVLWLVSEDNNPFIGAYGDSLAATPHLDRLAADGILYRNAYSTSPVCAPSRFALITGAYAETCGPAHNMRASGKIPSTLRGFPEYLRAAGYYCTNNAKTDYNAPINTGRTWNVSGDTAHWRNRPAGAPFFAVFNTDRTHESKIFGASPGDVTASQVRVPAYLPNDPAIRRDRAAYYDLMHKMDGIIGDRLAELEDAGLADDTIVFYYSDNGGVLPRSKRFCYEDGLRTALIVRVPPKWRHLAGPGPGSTVSAPVSLIDLPPTVLALAGVSAPAHLQGTAFLGAGNSANRQYAFGGRARMDERYDLVRTVTDGRYRYIRNYAPHRPGGQHVAYAWQEKSYQAWEQAHLDGKLPEVQDRFWREKPAEELYDLRADPDQVNNLVAGGQHADIVRRLRTALYDHMIKIHDNGFIPEGSPAEGYDQSRKAGAYPIADVIALADRAIARDAANLDHFVQRLTHANPVIRYWAAQGLLMLGPRGSAAASTLSSRLSAESSLQVRVVIAEALARLGTSGPAVTALGAIVDGDGGVPIRLQALNALTYIGSPAKAVLPAIRRAAASGEDYLHRAGRYLELVLTGEYRPGAVTP